MGGNTQDSPPHPPIGRHQLGHLGHEPSEMVPVDPAATGIISELDDVPFLRGHLLQDAGADMSDRSGGEGDGLTVRVKSYPSLLLPASAIQQHGYLHQHSIN